MISDKHFHTGTAYEHQMRVGLLLSKFNWPKVSSLAWISHHSPPCCQQWAVGSCRSDSFQVYLKTGWVTGCTLACWGRQLVGGAGHCLSACPYNRATASAAQNLQEYTPGQSHNKCWQVGLPELSHVAEPLVPASVCKTGSETLLIKRIMIWKGCEFFWNITPFQTVQTAPAMTQYLSTSSSWLQYHMVLSSCKYYQ